MNDPYCSSCHELLTEYRTIAAGHSERNVCPECWEDHFVLDAPVTCCACKVVDSQPGDEWGVDWTTDEQGRPYCSECGYLNPTSEEVWSDERAMTHIAELLGTAEHWDNKLSLLEEIADVVSNTGREHPGYIDGPDAKYYDGTKKEKKEEPMNNISVSPATARTVLGHYRLPGGWSVGGFDEALLLAFGRADSTNRAKLAIAFPEMAAAVSLPLQELAEIAAQR